jgi:hypothetical protein
MATPLARTSSLPFVSSLPYREAVQVKVTRMTVADREEPRAPVRHGTVGEYDDGSGQAATAPPRGDG